MLAPPNAVLACLAVALVLPSPAHAQGNADQRRAPTLGAVIGYSVPALRYGEIRSPAVELGIALAAPLSPVLGIRVSVTHARHAYDTEAPALRNRRFASALAGEQSRMTLMGFEAVLTERTRRAARFFTRGGLGALHLSQDGVLRNETYEQDGHTLRRFAEVAPPVHEVAPALLVGAGLQGRFGSPEGDGFGYLFDIGLMWARFGTELDSGPSEGASQSAVALSLAGGITIPVGGST